MFYDNLKAACEEKGLKISPTVVECGGSLGSISKWKNGAYPNSDIVIKLSMRLGVTSDYLLGLDEKSPITATDPDKQRLLEMFDLLTEREKGEIIGELKAITKDRIKRKSEGIA